MLVVLAMLSGVPGYAVAGDEDDVKAAVTAMFAALANRDADGWIDSHTVNSTSFAGAATGPMIAHANFDRVALRAQYAEADAAGTPIQPPIQVLHLNVNVMGNVAYTTGYLMIPPPPDSGNPPLRWRSTMIWVKQSGKWKRQHYHSSPLYPATSQ